MRSKTIHAESSWRARPYRWCLPVLVAMLVLMFPAVAEACPYCAGQPEGRSSYGAATLLMLLIPPALLGLLYLLVRDSLGGLGHPPHCQDSSP